MTTNAPVNILLVDDQPSKLLSYEVILKELGENLIKAGSAREALELLLKTEVALVLVDVCMPELDGFELARMLREHPRYQKTAIIFISAIHLSDLDRVRGYESGAVDYVPVPVIPEILRAKVKIFVELYRKTRQLEQLNDELERRVLERTAALETSMERLRLASEAAGFGTYDYNAAAGQFYWSSHLRRMVGMAEDEPLTLERALEFVHPDHRDRVREHMLGTAEGEGRREIEFKVIRRDGKTRWWLDRGQVMHTAAGSAGGCRLMGTILDITARKRTEERQKLLMEELDHRVKNILENVNAIARLSSLSATSVEDFVKMLEGRIHAMSKAHGLLRRSAWSGTTLFDLVTECLAAFKVQGERSISIEGPPIVVRPELTQSLTLILHELATNAMKHGALSVPTGRVSVSWSKGSGAGPMNSLLWKESGGPPVRQPVTSGFGLSVLKTAAREIGAVPECRFAEDGFIYRLEGTFEASAPPTVTSDSSALTVIEPEARCGPAGGPRVLLVEDEGLVALQLQMDLEENGYHVVGPGRTLQEGAALARSEQIDAALVDVRLGSETSASIAEILLARQIPFVFATGYTDSTILPEHLRHVPRLNKPYAMDVIRQTIERLVAEGSRAAQEGAAREARC
ncbi:MAG TPA: response regulator [Hyphomicrobiaceae bacterium]|nr:response regulator [Hyphomicrobiaceae bacterium]